MIRSVTLPAKSNVTINETDGIRAQKVLLIYSISGIDELSSSGNEV